MKNLEKTYFGKFKVVAEYLKKLEKNTLEHVKQNKLDKQLDQHQAILGNVADFFFQLKDSGLMTEENAENIISRVNPIAHVTVLRPEYCEKNIYALCTGTSIEVNPNIPCDDKLLTSADKQKLYTFHELGHAIIQSEKDYNLDNEMLNINNVFLVKHRSEPVIKKEDDTKENYAHLGHNVLNEWFAQEVAEKLTYKSIGKKRPAAQKQWDGLCEEDENGKMVKAKDGKELVFDSNFDYYGLFQPLSIAFAKATKSVGVNPGDTDEKVSDKLLEKVLRNGLRGFMILTADEYDQQDKGKDFAEIMSGFGSAYVAKYQSFLLYEELPSERPIALSMYDLSLSKLNQLAQQNCETVQESSQ